MFPPRGTHIGFFSNAVRITTRTIYTSQQKINLRTILSPLEIGLMH